MGRYRDVDKIGFDFGQVGVIKLKIRESIARFCFDQNIRCCNQLSKSLGTVGVF